MGKLLLAGFETGKIKDFKPHAAAFLDNLIAHESHHFGQIVLTLKQAGHLVKKSQPSTVNRETLMKAKPWNGRNQKLETRNQYRVSCN